VNHKISCRISSYLKFRDIGWSHLPTTGVKYVEANVPTNDDEATELEKNLTNNGLTALTMQGSCDIKQENSVDLMTPQFAMCKRFGTEYLFISVKAEDTDCDVVWQRLRNMGDAAQAHGVTAVMETHPDLVTNGEVGLDTMQNVDHPNVRINYDTANVYYYNHDVTTMSELEKVIDYVAAVHIKDTNGGYHDHEFPGLGKGVVDFPAVFKALDARGFDGPYTMELEGGFMSKLTQDELLAFIAECVDYLKSIDA